MRRNVTALKLQQFMEELARRGRGRGSVFFTGGATALHFRMREQTIDIDIKLDPEPEGVFEALAELKNKLDLNVELASPADFIPVAPDWRERSIFVAQVGHIGFYHFDLCAQILSKIERGHVQDLSDARGFLDHGEIDSQRLWTYFERIKPMLLRYPAIDPDSFESKLKAFLDGL